MSSTYRSSGSGKSTSRSSHSNSSNNNNSMQSSSIFQHHTSKRRAYSNTSHTNSHHNSTSLLSASDEDDDDSNDEEEKTSQDRQEQVRQRGRYSKQAVLRENGIIFHSSELGSNGVAGGSIRSYAFDTTPNQYASSGFDPELADPVGIASQQQQQQQQQPRSSSSRRRPMTNPNQSVMFATESDTTPRGDLNLHSSSSLSSSTYPPHDHLSAVAETTGKTIWQMWSRMKSERARMVAKGGSNATGVADVWPTAAATTNSQQKHSSLNSSDSNASMKSSSSSNSTSSSPSTLDYVAAGRAISSQLSRAGVRVRHNHLDVIHNLAGLERVWLRTHDGLEREEFVSFLKEVLKLPEEELSILFQKMDANADGSLSWDEYLSYLLIEVSHHWQFRSARGTYHLKDIDTPACSIGSASYISSILVLPKDSSSSSSLTSGTASAGGKYVLGGKDNSIQVWQSKNMTYQCHLPSPWRVNEGVGGSVKMSGGGGMTGGGGLMNSGGPDEHSNSSSIPLSTQRASYIGARRHGVSGGARQKRCGGGGWKDESRGRDGIRGVFSGVQSSGGGGGGSGVQKSGAGGGGGGSNLDDSIHRRMSHANSMHHHHGLSRIGLRDTSSAPSSSSSSGDPDSSLGGGGDGENYADGMNGDTEGDGSSYPSQSIRSRTWMTNALHTSISYYPTQKQLLVATMDKQVHVYQQSFRQFLQCDRLEVADTPQCMTVHCGNGGAAGGGGGGGGGTAGSHTSSSSSTTGVGGSGSSFHSSNSTTSTDLLIVGDTSGRCSGYVLPQSRNGGNSNNSSGSNNNQDNSLFNIGTNEKMNMQDHLGFIQNGIVSSATGGGQGSQPGNSITQSILNNSNNLLASSPFTNGGGGGSGGANSSSSSSFSTASRSIFNFQIHRQGESIRKLALIPGLGLLSAGMDAKLCISDIETERVTRSLSGHKRGIYSFAHCESHRCIISAGFDSRILVFDPYLPHATGSLPSHHSNILDIVVNERKNQIITTCSDKKIKIFDIRTFKMIQSLADSQEYTPYDELTAVAFDEEQQQLITASNKLRIWPVIIAPGNKTRRGGPAHSNLIVAICYSQVFQQIVSVSVDESVHLWDIYTGNSVFEFRTSHGSPLTAACLDHRGKRLLTGAHDGSVLMWNFHNGARMHEFTSRKREVTALLYLPRTLQCVVGIGWERSVVRWPDPNAPKNTEWLVQPMHHAEVCCATYHGSNLVTGGSDGEIIVWHMDSARVNKRIDIPKTPRTGKRPGVAKMLFLDFTHSNLLLLLCGTDDGSLHFLKINTSEIVFSLYDACNDPIIGMAINKRTEDGKHTRLFIADCQNELKLFDISGIKNEEIRELPLVRAIESTASAALNGNVTTNAPVHTTSTTTTDVIACDDINAFLTSTDTGEICIYSADDGEPLCKFAQRKQWPIEDTRQSRKGIGQNAGVTAMMEVKEQEEGESEEEKSETDEDEEDGSSSSSSSQEDTDQHPTLPGYSAAQSPRNAIAPRKLSRRKRAALQAASSYQSADLLNGRNKLDNRELSFLETHPMYLPKDECDKYLREHAQQTAMEAIQAQKEKMGKEREGRGGDAQTSRSKMNKIGLTDMLGKLEIDLKHQHERMNASNNTSHSNNSTNNPPSSSLGLSLDNSAAIHGAHVYEKFHVHHSTGASVQSTHSHFNTASTSSPPMSAGSASAAVYDPLGETNDRVSSTLTAPRPPRIRNIPSSSADDRELDTTNGYSSNSGAMTSRASARPSYSPTSGSVSHRDRARVSFQPGSRTISNSDVFSPPASTRNRRGKI